MIKFINCLVPVNPGDVCFTNSSTNKSEIGECLGGSICSNQTCRCPFAAQIVINYSCQMPFDCRDTNHSLLCYETLEFFHIFRTTFHSHVFGSAETVDFYLKNAKLFNVELDHLGPNELQLLAETIHMELKKNPAANRQAAQTTKHLNGFEKKHKFGEFKFDSNASTTSNSQIKSFTSTFSGQNRELSTTAIKPEVTLDIFANNSTPSQSLTITDILESLNKSSNMTELDFRVAKMLNIPEQMLLAMQRTNYITAFTKSESVIDLLNATIADGVPDNDTLAQDDGEFVLKTIHLKQPSAQALINRKPGDACLQSNECTFNAACLGRICVCNFGYVATSDGCFPLIVPYGDACIPERQYCISNSHCINKTCSCLTNQIFASGECYSPPNDNPGRFCKIEKDCSGNTHCVNGECQCKTGTVAMNGRCAFLEFIPIGEQCNPSESCYGGGVCIGGVCQCSEGSFALGGLCKQRPGGSCSQGQLCIEESTCQSGTCRCPQKWTIINETCKPGFAKPSQSCIDGEKCLGGSECFFGSCVCPANQILIDDQCKTNPDLVSPGASCAGNKICQGRSYCSPRELTCICQQGELMVGNECKPNVAYPGQDCRGGRLCIGNSQCDGQICQCPRGTVPDGNKCIPTRAANPAQPCEVGITCLGNSTCQLSLCRCKSGDTIVNGECRAAQLRAEPGQTCGVNGRACIGESFCTNGVCQCSRNQVLLNGQCVVNGTFAYPGDTVEIENEHRC